MSFNTLTHILGPKRGLITTQNRHGKPYSHDSIQRWLRLQAHVFKVDKVDLLIHQESTETCLGYLATDPLHIRISFRTACTTPPPDLSKLKKAGLFDIFLTPESFDTPHLNAWLSAAHEAQLPIRIQYPLPGKTIDANQQAQHLSQHSVRVVNIAATDPFQPLNTMDSPTQEATQAFINALKAFDIEINLLHIPFCQIDETLWPYIVNEAQFFHSHQHYTKASFELAHQLFDKGPIRASIILQMLQRRHTLMNNPIDNKLLPWITENPWAHARAVAWHRLTRHLKLPRTSPKAIEVKNLEEAEATIQAKANDEQSALGAICGTCKMRTICNNDQHPGTQVLATQPCKTIGGDRITHHLHFSTQRNTWCDELDQARYTQPERQEALANAARTITETIPPTLEIDSMHYTTVGQWAHQLPGGLRWYGFTNTQKQSTDLAVLSPPFTISYIIGGGIAENAGFVLSNHCTLVCPMIDTQHTLTLHVAQNGDYVLLRDGHPIQPIHFQGHGNIPTRLGDSFLSPRISIVNIDQSIVTQNLKIWHDSPSIKPTPNTIRYTIITVCVRYARRLQLMLQTIARQQDFDLSQIEIIIAHLPDVDPTEDVIESITLVHPEINIHRTTFAEDKANAKGFIINECVEKAQGDWVVLLDADTLIPPTFFNQLDSHTESTHFIAPDGRKLLSPETTAQVLLGNKTPWDHWDELLATPGEMRHREMDGVPIGFCQIIRRDCFEKVQYYEADHFEGADWQFSKDLRKAFGPETRLSGIPLLHLDHGGSKWYGTRRQY